MNFQSYTNEFQDKKRKKLLISYQRLSLEIYCNESIHKHNAIMHDCIQIFEMVKTKLG